MSGGTDRSAVARIIRAIPPDHESSVPVDGLPEPAAAGAVVSLLSAFGALVITTDPTTGALRVKAATTAAALFLKSLAEYVEQNSAVLHNWSRIGTAEPPHDEQAILSGPQFLYFMERRRMSGSSGAPALRSVRVSQVVVKPLIPLSIGWSASASSTSPPSPAATGSAPGTRSASSTCRVGAARSWPAQAAAGSRRATCSTPTRGLRA